MNRRLASVLLAGLAVSTLAGVTIALANSVSTTPAPAFVRSIDPSSGDDRGGDRHASQPGDDNGTDDPATHDIGDDHGGDRSVTPTSGATTSTTMTTAPGSNDDPATHDLGDDHGGDRSVTSTTGATSSTTMTTAPGSDDDPATHDLGDDHGGDRDRSDDSGRH